MTDLPLMLWTALDAGDDTAYAALIDYYLEAGNEAAAEGVRRAVPTRRRPYNVFSLRYSWCSGTLTRSSIHPLDFGQDLPRVFDHPTAAWEFLATMPEPAHAISE